LGSGSDHSFGSQFRFTASVYSFGSQLRFTASVFNVAVCVKLAPIEFCGLNGIVFGSIGSRFRRDSRVAQTAQPIFLQLSVPISRRFPGGSDCSVWPLAEFRMDYLIRFCIWGSGLSTRRSNSFELLRSGRFGSVCIWGLGLSTQRSNSFKLLRHEWFGSVRFGLNGLFQLWSGSVHSSSQTRFFYCWNWFYSALILMLTRSLGVNSQNTHILMIKRFKANAVWVLVR
jgi:hypothetical protein